MILTLSFRPISILPVLSKVWGHTFKNLIEESLGLDPFHDDQYGFRRKASTVDALRRVIDLADWSKKRNKIFVLAAVNVKNAFNTLSWNKILKEAESRGMPRKLVTLRENYFEDRKIRSWRRFRKWMPNFVHNLAVILDVGKQEEADNKLSTALSVIVRWCADKGLKIA